MKILVSQIDPLARGMLESVLTRWGHQVVLSESGTEALAKLIEQGGPSLAIMDAHMPGLDGLQVCQQIRQSASGPHIYLMLVVAKGREQDVVEGLKAEADDFLTAPLNTDELMVRLRIAKRILDLQEEVKRSQDAIGYQTTHDTLTGLANRTGVVDALQREMARVRREQTHTAIILGELDDFKNINDEYGYAAGDAVLREVARRIRSVVRPYDTIGRYGGEEFLIVAPGCDAKSALTQADRLRAAVAQGGMDLSEWGKYTTGMNGKLRVTLSLGLAVGDKVTETQPFLRAAEAALRRAKKAGKDRVDTARDSDFH